MDQQTQHSDDQGSISEDDFVRLDDELPATVEMNVLEQEKQQQDQTQQLILRQLEHLQQSQQITPAFKPEQSPFQQTEMAAAINKQAVLNILGALTVAECGGMPPNFVPQNTGISGGQPLGSSSGNTSAQQAHHFQQLIKSQLQLQQQQAQPQQELLQQLQLQQQQLLLQQRQQILQFQQRPKQQVYQIPQQTQNTTAMLCEYNNTSLKETSSGGTTFSQENDHLKMSILETKNQLLEEKLKNRELMDQIHALTEENKALKCLKETDEKSINKFEELQRKMDEFQEEYEKKLSLQNDQLEKLKKAFLGFQQKVEDSKRKLNGLEGEGQQDQQKMALGESIPTKSSLANSTISDQQQSDLTDINEKLRQLEVWQDEMKKSTQTPTPPMSMTMEAKIAAINKHFAIDVGNIDYSAINQLLEVHFSWSGPFRKLADTSTGHPSKQTEQSGLGQTVQPNGPGHGQPAKARQIMETEQPTAEEDPVPEEKRKVMQQQLALMLHARKCQQEDRLVSQEAGGMQPCYAVHCTCMKGLLEHMTSCKYGTQCLHPKCAISQQSITHWKNCCKDECPVCTPLKKKYNNNNNTNHGADVASVNDECTSNPATQQMSNNNAQQQKRIESNKMTMA